MRPARDILREDRGVSIVFAVLLVVVLLILGGIVLSYGYSNFHRATTDITSEQNYQTVSSATKLVRQELDGVRLTQSRNWNWSWSDYSSDPSWVANLINQTSQTVTVSGFDNVTVTAAKGSGNNYTIKCSETDDSSSVILEFSISLTIVTYTWNQYATISSKATNSPITKVGE